jgi:hypothetical protein
MEKRGGLKSKNVKGGILEKEKEKLLKMSEISLWLDTYNDIFSSFDPRPYSGRALSDDFLIEAKKASREKVSGQIELKLLAPKKLRSVEQEATIKKRLQEHFKKHYNLLKEEARNIKITGGIMTFVGVLLMFAAGWLASINTKIVYNFLLVLLEPAGWFMAWFGLERIFYISALKKADLEFYEKMSKVTISFWSY